MSWSWNEPNNVDSGVTVTGGRIALDVPTAISGIELAAERTGNADTCAGPAACGIDLDARVDRMF